MRRAIANLLNLEATPDFIRQLQTSLKTLGYYQGDITGVFDDETNKSFAYGVAVVQRHVNIEIDPNTLNNLVGNKVALQDLQGALNISVDGYYGADTHNATMRALHDGVLAQPENAGLASFATLASRMSEMANENIAPGQRRVLPSFIMRPIADAVSAEVRTLPLFEQTVSAEQELKNLKSPDLIQRVSDAHQRIREETAAVLQEGGNRTIDPSDPNFATGSYYLATKISEAHILSDEMRAEISPLIEEARFTIAQETQSLEIERGFLEDSLAAEKRNFEGHYQTALDLRNDPTIAAAIADDTLKHHSEVYDHYTRALAEVTLAQEALTSAQGNEQDIAQEYGMYSINEIDDPNLAAARASLASAREVLSQTEAEYFSELPYLQNKYRLELVTDEALTSLSTMSDISKRIAAIDGQIETLSVRNAAFQADIEAIEIAPNVENDTDRNIVTNLSAVAPFGEVTSAELPLIPGTTEKPNLRPALQDVSDVAGVWSEAQLRNFNTDLQREVDAATAERNRLADLREQEEALKAELLENRISQNLSIETHAQTSARLDELKADRTALTEERDDISARYEEQESGDIHSTAYIRDHVKITMLDDQIASTDILIDRYAVEVADLETANADLISDSRRIKSVLKQNAGEITAQQAMVNGGDSALADIVARERAAVVNRQNAVTDLNEDFGVLAEEGRAKLGVSEEDFWVSVWARDLPSEFDQNREAVLAVTAASLPDVGTIEETVLRDLGLLTPTEDALGNLLKAGMTDHLDFASLSPSLLLVQDILNGSDNNLHADAPTEQDAALVWNAAVRGLDFTDQPASDQRIIAAKALIAGAHNLSFDDVAHISDQNMISFMMGEPLQDETLSQEILDNPYNVTGDILAVQDAKTAAITQKIQDMTRITQQDVYGLLGESRAIAQAIDLEDLGADIIDRDDPFGTLGRIQAQNVAEFQNPDLMSDLIFPWHYAARSDATGANAVLAEGFADIVDGSFEDMNGFTDALTAWRDDLNDKTPRNILEQRAEHWKTMLEQSTASGDLAAAELAGKYYSMMQGGLSVLDRADNLLAALESKDVVLLDIGFQDAAQDGLSQAETLQALLAARNNIDFDALDPTDVQAYLDTGTVPQSLIDAGIDPDNALNLSASIRIDDASEAAQSGAIIAKEAMLLDMIRNGDVSEDADQAISVLSARAVLLSDHDVTLDASRGITHEGALAKLENITRIDGQLSMARGLVADHGAELLNGPNIAAALIAVQTGLDYNDVLNDVALQVNGPNIAAALIAVQTGLDYNDVLNDVALQDADLTRFMPVYSTQDNVTAFQNIAGDNDNNIVDGRSFEERLVAAGVELDNPLASASEAFSQAEIVQVARMSMTTPERLEAFLTDNGALEARADQALESLSVLMPEDGTNPEDPIEQIFGFVFDNGRTDFSASLWKQILATTSTEELIGPLEYEGQEAEIPNVIHFNIEKLTGEAGAIETTMTQISRLNEIEARLMDLEPILDRAEQQIVDNGRLQDITSEEHLKLTDESTLLYLSRLELQEALAASGVTLESDVPTDAIERLQAKILTAQSEIEIQEAKIIELQERGFLDKVGGFFGSFLKSAEQDIDPQTEIDRLKSEIEGFNREVTIEQRAGRLVELGGDLEIKRAEIVDERVSLTEAMARLDLSNRYQGSLRAADLAIEVENDPAFQADLKFFSDTVDYMSDAAQKQFLARTLIAARHDGLSYGDVHITDVQAAHLFKYGTLSQPIPGVSAANPFNLDPAVVDTNRDQSFTDNAGFFKTKYFIENILDTEEFQDRFKSDPQSAINHAMFTSHWVSNQQIGTNNPDAASRLQGYVDLNTSAVEAQASVSRAKLLLQEAQGAITRLSGPDAHLSTPEFSKLSLRANMAAVMAHRHDGLSFKDAFTAVSAMTDQNLRTLLQGRLEITQPETDVATSTVEPIAVNAGWSPR